MNDADCLILFHPDSTVGTGFSPVLLTSPQRRALAGFPGYLGYRRWGLSPRPENKSHTISILRLFYLSICGDYINRQGLDILSTLSHDLHHALRTLKVNLSGRYPIIRLIQMSVLLALPQGVILPMPKLFT